jgi:hypothetical protein
MTFRRIILPIALICVCYAIGSAQQPSPTPIPSPTPSSDSYIRRNSIGYKDSPRSTSNRIPFQTRSISAWVGERFIFMPRKASFQRYGYQLINPIDDEFGKLPYQDYVGKIAKVLAVAPSKFKIEGFWEVFLEVEGTGQKLRAEAYGESVEGLANLQDIDDARTKYLGKKVQYNGQILSRYNAVTDKVEFFTIPKNMLVDVTDVIVSWEQTAPVRFVVQTSKGEEGFIDVNMSGTNISKVLQKFHQFNDTFIARN